MGHHPDADLIYRLSKRASTLSAAKGDRIDPLAFAVAIGIVEHTGGLDLAGLSKLPDNDFLTDMSAILVKAKANG